MLGTHLTGSGCTACDAAEPVIAEQAGEAVEVVGMVSMQLVRIRRSSYTCTRREGGNLHVSCVHAS
jgi:hypothetical protein